MRVKGITLSRSNYPKSLSTSCVKGSYVIRGRSDDQRLIVTKDSVKRAVGLILSPMSYVDSVDSAVTL